MKSQQLSRPKWLLGSAIAVLVLSLAVTVAGVAHASYYAERALPGSTLLGHDIGGYTHAEITALVNDQANAATLDIKIDDDTTTAKLADLGITVDAAATADAVLTPNQEWIQRFDFSKRDETPLVTSIDASVLNSYGTDLAATKGTPVVNATVSVTPEGGFTYSESSDGITVDASALADAAKKLAETLQPAAITLDAEHAQPTLTTAQAEAIAAAANQLVIPEVILTDGITDFEASPQDKALWVALPEAGHDGTPTVDPAKVKEWVNARGVETNEVAPKGKRYLNEQGEEVAVIRPGGLGYTVNNVDQLSAELQTALTEGRSFVGEFNYDRTEPELEDVILGNWENDAVYVPDPGEKWIDIDLSANMVSAYEGRKLVRGPVLIVPGDPRTPTVTGYYSVYLKYQSQTMRGLNIDGTPYETPNVPWVMYFTGGYALHGAYWRSSFGWSGYGGSHGCVNMPVAEAEWFYHWTDYGTTVVSHY